MAFPPASRSARLDQVGKRILRSIADHVQVDAAALAKELDVAEDVVRARLCTMRESGLVQGFRLRIDPRRLGQSFEFLVTGAPTDRMDRDALGGLCADPQVTRAFGLASSHSVAFMVVGRDLAGTRAHALALAERAGLRQAQVTLVVATFEDRSGQIVPDWLGAEAPEAPGAGTLPSSLVAVGLAGASPVAMQASSPAMLATADTAVAG